MLPISRYSEQDIKGCEERAPLLATTPPAPTIADMGGISDEEDVGLIPEPDRGAPVEDEFTRRGIQTPALVDYSPLTRSSCRKLRISGVALTQLGAMALGIQAGLAYAGLAASSVGLGVAGGALILGLFLIALGHKEKSTDYMASIVTAHAFLALGTFVSAFLSAYAFGYLAHTYNPAFNAADSLAREAGAAASDKIAAEALIPGTSVYDRVAGGTSRTLFVLRKIAAGRGYDAVMRQHGYVTFLFSGWEGEFVTWGGIGAAGLALTSLGSAIALEAAQD